MRQFDGEKAKDESAASRMAKMETTAEILILFGISKSRDDDSQQQSKKKASLFDDIFCMNNKQVIFC